MQHKERSRCIAQVDSNSVDEFTDQLTCCCCYLTFTCLVCTSKLPGACSNLVRNMLSLTSNKLAWQGIRALYKDLLNENKKQRDCKETMQMLAAWLSKEYNNILLTSKGETSLPCSVIPSWLTMVCT